MTNEKKSPLVEILRNYLDTNGFISFSLPVSLVRPYHIKDNDNIVKEINLTGLWSYNLLTYEIWLSILYNGNMSKIEVFQTYADHIHLIIDESVEYEEDFKSAKQKGIGVISINTINPDLDIEDRITFAKISKLQSLEDEIRSCYADLVRPTELKKPWWVGIIKFNNKKQDRFKTLANVQNIDKIQLWEKIQDFVQAKLSTEIDHPTQLLDYLSLLLEDANIPLEDQLTANNELTSFETSELVVTTSILNKLGFNQN